MKYSCRRPVASIFAVLALASPGGLRGQTGVLVGVTSTATAGSTTTTTSATPTTPATNASVVQLVSGTAIPVTVTVDAANVVRTVDPRGVGLNAVMWDDHASTAQSIALLQTAGVRTLRIPGGSLSDVYHWTVNKSEEVNATVTPATRTLNTWTWPTGMNGFSQIIAGLNCQDQTYATVNYGTGTPEEAAAWVAYANAPATLLGTGADVTLGVDADQTNWQTAGTWSAMRAASALATDDGHNFLRAGRTARLGIKYWEIGNECYGTWEADVQGLVSNRPGVAHDPYTYAVRVRDYIAKMKAVDPTIKIGVVAVPGVDADANNTNHPVADPHQSGKVHNGWTPVMLATLRSLGVTPDFLIYHRYEQSPNAESDAGLLQAAKTWASDAADLRQQLTDYLGSAGAGVELVVTENNSVYTNPGKQSTSLVNGLFLADSFANVLQTEFNGIVWWAMRNSPPTDSTGKIIGNLSDSLYGWRHYGDYGVISTPAAGGSTSYYETYPTYYAIKLLSHFAAGGDQVVKTTSASTLLSAYAVKRTDGTLALLVINKDPTTTYEGDFVVQGFTPQRHAPVYTYGTVQDNAAKNGTGLADIAYSSLSGAGATFAADFAPYSATVIALTPAAATPSRLVNISARAACQTGNKVTIGGFVTNGGAKQVLLRAVGPTLTTQGIGQTEMLADPVIELHDALNQNAIVTTNDNWGDTAGTAVTTTGAQVGATPLASADTTSAAAVQTLNSGVFSFIASGKNNTSGIVLVEVYDADASSSASALVNISARAYCTTGNGVTIGGFVIAGNAPKHVLLRAVGPSLTAQQIGATELLADPKIDVYRNGAVIATNDNWGDNADAVLITSTAAAIGAQALLSSDTASSALLLTLPPGVYSFIAGGKNGTSGIVLIEVYDADAATGTPPTIQTVNWPGGS